MSDKDILELYSREGGKEQAFNLIVRTYTARLYACIRRMVTCHDDADDILQEVFVKVWNSLPDFRGDSGLYTWIYRIAINHTLTFLRKEKIRKFLSLTDYEEYVSSRIEADATFNGDELAGKLHRAVATLPPKQRIVFTMRYFDEMKYEEIAETLGGSVGSLKASYHHAYTKISKIIGKEEN